MEDIQVRKLNPKATICPPFDHPPKSFPLKMLCQRRKRGLAFLGNMRPLLLVATLV